MYVSSQRLEHAFTDTYLLLRKRASFIYGLRLRMNSKFYQMRVALSRCFILPADMDSRNWPWTRFVF